MTAPAIGAQCKACSKALADISIEEYGVGCHHCQARAVARSKEYATAAAMGRITPPYRALLGTILLPQESIDEAHRRVRALDLRIVASNLTPD